MLDIEYSKRGKWHTCERRVCDAEHPLLCEDYAENTIQNCKGLSKKQKAMLNAIANGMRIIRFNCTGWFISENFGADGEHVEQRTIDRLAIRGLVKIFLPIAAGSHSFETVMLTEDTNYPDGYG